MTTVTIDLRDELTREAKGHGLLKAAALEVMLRSAGDPDLLASVTS